LLQSRELNPHFANSGDGVPPPAAAGANPKAAGVGDGGTSWRLKALRRAQAAAAEGGKDVREVRRPRTLQDVARIRQVAGSGAWAPVSSV
jgi:hypothetical protein